MANYLLGSYVLIHLGLLGWSFRWADNASARIWLLRLMLIGMSYDNLMLAIGNSVIDAPWYEFANRPRYLLHAGVLPFLALFSLSIMKHAGVAIAHRPALGAFIWAFTVAALVYGLWHEFILLELVPADNIGVRRLVGASGLPPLATIATNILILPCAALIWRAAAWPWLFLGALFILLMNGATGAQPWGFLAGNSAEVVFIYCLLKTEQRFGAATRGGHF